MKGSKASIVGAEGKQMMLWRDKFFLGGHSYQRANRPAPLLPGRVVPSCLRNNSGQQRLIFEGLAYSLPWLRHADAVRGLMASPAPRGIGWRKWAGIVHNYSL